MFNIGNRLFAAIIILSSAGLFTGVGIALSNADEPKVPDLSDLRDAVNAASKKGDNVAEIRKALDALEKTLAKGWTAPASGKTIEPPAELVALRDAVEAAARKGEKVEAIRKELDTVEKALTGKVQAKPKPLTHIEPIQPEDPLQQPFGPNPNILPFQLPFQPPAIPQPFFPGAGIDPDAIQKAQDLTKRAAEMLLKNPEDPEALKMMQQAQEMMLKAMIAGRGGIARGVDPGMLGGPFGRVPERFRLGVRLERVSELAADQLGLEVARGVGIIGVVEGSAAEKAGFKKNDIVLEFAGKPVTDNPDDFTRQVSDVKAGEKVNAVVMRKGKKVEIKGIELPDVPRAINRNGPFEGMPPLPDLRPAAPMLPLPPLGPVPNPNPRGKGAGDANNERIQTGNSVAYSVINGQLTIKAFQDGVIYIITGQRDGAETDVSKIVIRDGDKKIEAEKVDKVPEQYRPVVERLLKGGQGQVVRP